MRQVASQKGIDLLAVGPMINHVHLLVNASGRQELARAMNLLKGISARRLFERFPDLKIDKAVDHFWQHRYAAKEVPDGSWRSVTGYITTQDLRPEKLSRDVLLHEPHDGVR